MSSNANLKKLQLLKDKLELKRKLQKQECEEFECHDHEIEEDEFHTHDPEHLANEHVPHAHEDEEEHVDENGNKIITSKKKQKKCCNCEKPKWFIRLSNKLESICESTKFEKLIIILILLNTLTLALEMYEAPDALDAFLNTSRAPLFPRAALSAPAEANAPYSVIPARPT